jgi:hypothetical protein
MVGGDSPDLSETNPISIFTIALLLQVVLPLAPLAVEWAMKSRVRDQSLIVVAPLYTFILGASCAVPVILVLGLVTGVFMLAMRGVGLDVRENMDLGRRARIFLLAAMALNIGAFTVDRWYVHVTLKEPLGPWHVARSSEGKAGK